MYRDTHCDHMWDALSAYADGEATPAEAARVECHTAGCSACANILAFMRQTSDLLDGASMVEPPPYLRDRILAATIGKERAEGPARQPVRGWPWATRLSLAGAACAMALLVLMALPSITRVPSRSLVARAPLPLKPAAVGAMALASRAPGVTNAIRRIAAAERGIGASLVPRHSAETHHDRADARAPATRAALRGPAHVSSGRRSAPIHVPGAPTRRLSPYLNPERPEAPGGPPAGGAAPAPPGPVSPAPMVARNDADTGPAEPVTPVETAPEHPARRVILASLSSDGDGGTSVTTISDLRRALRSVHEPATRVSFADRREVTVNFVQSKF